MDEIGDSREATEFRYDFWAESLHEHGIANMAMSRKPHNSRRGDSDDPQTSYYADMEIQQIKALIAERNETQAGLARLIGISSDQFSRSMLGKRKFTVREMDTLRRYFGEKEDSPGAPLLLPIVGLVSAGLWREGFEQIMGYMPSPDKALSAKSFVVLVQGDSMDKVAAPGEGIIIDPTDLDLVSGRYYVIRNGDGETTFKQYREGPARLEPCSTNPIHKAIYPGRDDFTVIGRARKRIADL